MAFMKIKNAGGEQLVARFRYGATKIPENARKLLHRAADSVVKEARLNAPVDDGELEASIHKEVSYEGRGRLKIDVVAGGVINGIDVDRYALIIHEHYESMKPGRLTLAKQAANPGRYVGSKFLQRAIEGEKPRLEKAMVKVILEL